MDMKDRLMQILKKENISYAKFADIIDVQRSSISHILSGRNNPSFDFIQKILIHFPKINAEWLITGNGDMYKPKRTDNDLFSAVEMKDNLKNEHEISNEKQPQSIENKSVSKKITNVNSIKKIVIFYQDNSFEEYIPR